MGEKKPAWGTLPDSTSKIGTRARDVLVASEKDRKQSTASMLAANRGLCFKRLFRDFPLLAMHIHSQLHHRDTCLITALYQSCSYSAAIRTDTKKAVFFPQQDQMDIQVGEGSSGGLLCQRPQLHSAVLQRAQPRALHPLAFPRA